MYQVLGNGEREASFTGYYAIAWFSAAKVRFEYRVNPRWITYYGSHSVGYLVIQIRDSSAALYQRSLRA